MTHSLCQKLNCNRTLIVQIIVENDSFLFFPETWCRNTKANSSSVVHQHTGIYVRFDILTYSKCLGWLLIGMICSPSTQVWVLLASGRADTMTRWGDLKK